MTTYTDNLEIPHLDQNVAQPEIPENVAKDILDAIFSGYYKTDFPSDGDLIYGYTADPTEAQPWHNFVQDFVDDIESLTIPRTVTFPVNNRPYLLINNTDQILNFEIDSQLNDSIPLPNGGASMYCYSDGENLLKIPFNIPTEQTVISSSNLMTIDLDKGAHIYYAAIEASTITITTSYASTSFKMMINDGATSIPTFSSVAWAVGTAPTWTTGNDLVEFTMINSIWVGHAIALNVSIP